MLYCNNLLPTIRFNIVQTLKLSTSTTNICMNSFHLDIFFSEENHEFDYLIRKTSYQRGGGAKCSCFVSYYRKCSFKISIQHQKIRNLSVARKSSQCIMYIIASVEDIRNTLARVRMDNCRILQNINIFD